MDNKPHLDSTDKEYLNNIFSHLPVGLKLYNKEGRLIELNDVEMEMLGIKDKKDILGVSLFDNPNIPDDVINRLKAGERVHCVIKYDFKLAKQYFATGFTSTRYFDFTASTLYDDNGNIDKYLVITQDATERVLFNEQLRLSKLKTEMVMKASDIMIWEFDTATGMFSCENKPVEQSNWNSRFTPEEYLNTINPKDLPLTKEIVQKMIQGEDVPSIREVEMKFPDQEEWQYCTVSNQAFEKDTSGKVVRYVGFVKNNTRFRKNEILLQRILNSMPLAVQIKDVEDNFKYVFCNEESERLFGITKDKTTDEILPVKQVEKIHKIDYDVFHTGKTYLGQERIPLKDGRTYDTIVQKSIVEHNGKRLVLTVRWDLSIQKELERKNKMFSISLSALNAFTWWYDVETDTLKCGDGFEKFGRNINKWHNIETFINSVHPDEQEYVRQTMMNMCKQDSGEFVMEYRIDTEGDGNYIWWESRGAVETIKEEDSSFRYMFGVDINIEANKKTELQLISNEEKMTKLIRQNELVLNNANSGLAYITKDYIVQWENISICSVNMTFEAYKKGEICYQSAHGRTTPCEGCIMQKAMRSGQMEHAEFLLQNNNVIEVFATPVLNKDGAVDGIVIRVDNVTERRQMITEMELAKQKAEESDKLKSAFLANMSHEIRTPLNAIVGFSDLLMTTVSQEEKEEYIRIINTNNELLLKLINDILDLSKIESGSIDLKYEEFDLTFYFNELYTAMQQRVVNPDVTLLASNPYASCIVKLDKNRLAQIITNFVTNSIKFTSKGFIQMGYEAIDEGIRLYVRDTGMGIPEEKKDKVFQRFEKLNEFAQGTGLGLSICKAIAETCGGSLGFESKQGQGSTFWAILPCRVKIDRPQDQVKQPASLSTPFSEIAKTGGANNKKTVLVVEDNPHNFQLVAIILGKEYNVIHSPNGLKAVELVRKQPVDLILMDMKMPVMDGLTATKEIRAFNDKIPIIALTAHAFKSDRDLAIQAGCNDYLVKPIDKKILLDTLKAYCKT